MLTTTIDIHDRENCPFCGSINIDDCGDYVRCIDCSAFGPDGSENWQKRAMPRRVKTLLQNWKHRHVDISENAPTYSAAYDAIDDFINELEEAYESH